MNEGELSTRDILLEFGFQPDETVISDVQPGLSLRFGDFKLSAAWMINDHYVDVVYVSGVYNTGDTIGMVDIQLPRQMESREQCAAWLVSELGKRLRRAISESPVQYEWFELGKDNKDKLPWIIDQAAYNARPQCTVERRWLRLALNTLTESLQDAGEEECVIISFQNKILSIQCNEHVIPSPGKGEPWPDSVLIKANSLQKLPKRLMMDPVLIDIWKDQLGIDRCRYPLHKTTVSGA